VSVYVLIAIVKKRLNGSASLYEILQILSLMMFERMPINQLLSRPPRASDYDRPDIARRRAQWQGLVDPARLVFIDETWAKTNMTRTHGRAPRVLAHSFRHQHSPGTGAVRGQAAVYERLTACDPEGGFALAAGETYFGGTEPCSDGEIIPSAASGTVTGLYENKPRSIASIPGFAPLAVTP
jgi:hypothetical protein